MFEIGRQQDADKPLAVYLSSTVTFDFSLLYGEFSTMRFRKKISMMGQGHPPVFPQFLFFISAGQRKVQLCTVLEVPVRLYSNSRNRNSFNLSTIPVSSAQLEKFREIFLQLQLCFPQVSHF